MSRSFCWTHREDVGITSSLKKCESVGDDVGCQAEERKLCGQTRRDRDQCAGGIEREAKHNRGLVGKLADEHDRWNRHTEVARVEGELQPRGLRGGDDEDLLKPPARKGKLF